MSSVVNDKTIDFGEFGSVQVPGITQSEVISCLCQILNSFEPTERKEFFDLLGNVQDDIESELSKANAKLTSFRRFVRENLQSKKQLQEQINDVREFKEKLNEGLGNIVGDCPPAEQFSALLDGIERLAINKIEKVDRRIIEEVDNLLDPIEQKIDQLTELIRLIDALKFCEGSPDDFTGFSDQLQQNIASLSNLDEFEK